MISISNMKFSPSEFCPYGNMVRIGQIPANKFNFIATFYYCDSQNRIRAANFRIKANQMFIKAIFSIFVDQDKFHQQLLCNL